MEIKTPYYLINQEELDAGYDKLCDALKNNWNNYIVGYSFKTNSLPWIINHLKHKGIYAEVVSEDEYKLAKRIGFEKNKIVYNGPIKTKETFLMAVADGAIVNIDSNREIEWLNDLPKDKEDYQIGIRVNFDIESYCPFESQCGAEGGRFGFCFENGDLEKAVNKIKDKGIKISGLHLHTSSKTRSVNIYRAIATVACKIKEELNLDLSYVDVGGGFYGGLDNKPQFEEYFSEIANILRNEFDLEHTKLIVEPGMCLVGSPVSYVASVIDVKDTTYNRFVVTDATRTSIDPLMTKKSYYYSFEGNNSTKKLKKQIICGSTCMEHDRLFEADSEIELFVGDKIIFNKVGAYTMCLTPLFINYFPCVYVKNKDKISLVRSHWTEEEYMSCSILGDK